MIKEIPLIFDYSTEAADKRRLNTKKKQPTIVPYDWNRIKLPARSEELSPSTASDYINASAISHSIMGPSISYIAAQAPNIDTVGDFLLMIYDQGVHVIAMLCSFFEKCEKRCEKYWADSEMEAISDTERFGEYLAYEVSSQDGKLQANVDGDEAGFTVRKLVLKPRKDDTAKPSRIIHHLHFTEWPDHGVPKSERAVLEYLDILNSLHAAATTSPDETTKVNSPLLVHCSAGAGRTGALIAAAMLRKLIGSGKAEITTEDSELMPIKPTPSNEEEFKLISTRMATHLKELVVELRRQRMFMYVVTFYAAEWYRETVLDVEVMKQRYSQSHATGDVTAKEIARNDKKLERIREKGRSMKEFILSLIER